MPRERSRGPSSSEDHMRKVVFVALACLAVAGCNSTATGTAGGAAGGAVVGAVVGGPGGAGGGARAAERSWGVGGGGWPAAASAPRGELRRARSPKRTPAASWRAPAA